MTRVSQAPVSAQRTPSQSDDVAQQETSALVTTRGVHDVAASSAFDAVVPEASVSSRPQLDDPPLARHFMFRRLDNTGIEYRELPNATLVDGGMNANDVNQGLIGDCYFLATLAGFAATRPQVLSDALTDNHDGTYTVRFFREDEDGVRAEFVTVDSELPLRFGSPVYAQAYTREIWPAIFEKAYAQFRGGYGYIGNGGLPDSVLFALTGDRGSVRLLSATSAESTGARIERALANGHPVITCTMPELLRGARRHDGLVPTHAYTVERVVVEGDVTYVELRNPHGFQEPVSTPHGTQYSAGYGVFRLRLDDFKASFPAVFIGD